jgi:ribose 5-phosphate isomerase B
MKVFISSDHGGFQLKQHILEQQAVVAEKTHMELEFVDLGPFALNPDDDYPKYAFQLGERLISDIASPEEKRGILICRSGNGMTIAANKVKGIRAALCFSVEHARKAREDDHANVLVLDADYQTLEQHTAIIQAFLFTHEQPGRHQRRVDQITKYEQVHFK